MSDLREELNETGQLALALAPASLREGYTAALALDHRLARIASTAREPMLAQIRLAWWRDRLGEDVALRPRGDPVLDAVGRAWRGEEDGLRALVDGWEQMVGDAPGIAEAGHLAQAKARCFTSLARLAGQSEAEDKAALHGRAWGYADAALLSDRRDGICADYLEKEAALPRLPKALRPLALIGNLSRRALQRGGGALMGDRTSPLAAARIAMFGR